MIMKLHKYLVIVMVFGLPDEVTMLMLLQQLCVQIDNEEEMMNRDSI